MRRPSREAWIAIGALATAVIIAFSAALYEARSEAQHPPLDSTSNARNGARALWLWLDEMGYTVSNQVGTTFDPPENAGVMLILQPTQGIDEGEWDTIDAWVEDGGTLVIVGNGLTMMYITRHYDFELSFSSGPDDLTVQTPLLASPPMTDPVNAKPRAYLRTDRDDYVTHLADDERPLVVSFPSGNGLVILSAVTFPFTNEGLKAPGNPELAFNLVAPADPSRIIWFDEWHHGRMSTKSTWSGPSDWLLHTPSGRALLYVAGVIFVALVLQGRRFGRSVPPRQAINRRTPLEYITAIANLNRRAGHRSAVLRQHRQQLKRSLGKRYRLDPTMADDEYVARLAEFDPNLDAPALTKLLARLRQSQVSESEMIQLAAEVATWIKE